LEKKKLLVSFDIDGTLEVGDPPGGVTLDMVRRAKAAGIIVGSCSDRPSSAQRNIWLNAGIEVDFVSVKHKLIEVKDKHSAERYFHIGDRDLDEQAAALAGFEFWWHTEGPDEPWLKLIEDVEAIEEAAEELIEEAIERRVAEAKVG